MKRIIKRQIKVAQEPESMDEGGGLGGLDLGGLGGEEPSGGGLGDLGGPEEGSPEEKGPEEPSEEDAIQNIVQEVKEIILKEVKNEIAEGIAGEEAGNVLELDRFQTSVVSSDQGCVLSDMIIEEEESEEEDEKPAVPDWLKDLIKSREKKDVEGKRIHVPVDPIKLIQEINQSLATEGLIDTEHVVDEKSGEKEDQRIKDLIEEFRKLGLSPYSRGTNWVSRAQTNIAYLLTKPILYTLDPETQRRLLYVALLNILLLQQTVLYNEKVYKTLGGAIKSIFSPKSNKINQALEILKQRPFFESLASKPELKEIEGPKNIAKWYLDLEKKQNAMAMIDYLIDYIRQMGPLQEGMPKGTISQLIKQLLIRELPNPLKNPNAWVTALIDFFKNESLQRGSSFAEMPQHHKLAFIWIVSALALFSSLKKANATEEEIKESGILQENNEIIKKITAKFEKPGWGESTTDQIRDLLDQQDKEKLKEVYSIISKRFRHGGGPDYLIFAGPRAGESHEQWIQRLKDLGSETTGRVAPSFAKIPAKEEQFKPLKEITPVNTAGIQTAVNKIQAEGLKPNSLYNQVKAFAMLMDAYQDILNFEPVKKEWEKLEAIFPHFERIADLKPWGYQVVSPTEQYDSTSYENRAKSRNSTIQINRTKAIKEKKVRKALKEIEEKQGPLTDEEKTRAEQEIRKNLLQEKVKSWLRKPEKHLLSDEQVHRETKRISDMIKDLITSHENSYLSCIRELHQNYREVNATTEKEEEGKNPFSLDLNKLDLNPLRDTFQEDPKRGLTLLPEEIKEHYGIDTLLYIYNDLQKTFLDWLSRLTQNDILEMMTDLPRHLKLNYNRLKQTLHDLESFKRNVESMGHKLMTAKGRGYNSGTTRMKYMKLESQIAALYEMILKFAEELDTFLESQDKEPQYVDYLLKTFQIPEGRRIVDLLPAKKAGSPWTSVEVFMKSLASMVKLADLLYNIARGMEKGEPANTLPRLSLTEDMDLFYIDPEEQEAETAKGFKEKQKEETEAAESIEDDIYAPPKAFHFGEDEDF